MDDGIGDSTDDDVCWLMGEIMLEDGSLEYWGMVAQIMERGSFFIKYIIQDREARPEVLTNFDRTLLGIPRNTANDVISMRPTINLSKRIQRV